MMELVAGITGISVLPGFGDLRPGCVSGLGRVDGGRVSGLIFGVGLFAERHEVFEVAHYFQTLFLVGPVFVKFFFGVWEGAVAVEIFEEMIGGVGLLALSDILLHVWGYLL